MPFILLISVRFHDDRYHGTGDWPPAPARLFQALIAGIGQDGPLRDTTSPPLKWLEELQPPVIAAPTAPQGQAVTYYVPNNQLDAHGGDPRKIGLTRDAMIWQPRLFQQDEPVLYAWTFPDTEADRQHAKSICIFAERLYQLGRGIDLAWAWGEIFDTDALEPRLASYSGAIHRPTDGSGGTILLCPQEGSLQSLKDRYAAMSRRFQLQGQGRSAKWRFTQAPRPRFRPVAYDCPPSRQLYELRHDGGSLVVWPLNRSAPFVEHVRDGAAKRLRSSHTALVDRCLIGRPADAGHVPHGQRIRLIPIPSIGFVHADHGIRRLLVEVHSGCPLPAEDVFWAFSGLTVEGSILTTAVDKGMLHHFGVGRDHVIWRTVSPIVLPSGRRRITPHRRHEEAKHGNERGEEQQRAAAALVQAIRHAGIAARAESIRLQREPFHAKGERVESFAPGTRFPKERLWHAEIAFAEPVSGPLILGDGRYCGLGLLAPPTDA